MTSARSLLVLLAALPVLAGGRGAGVGAGSGGPAFMPQQRTAVLARVGDSVDLSCRVLRLADRAVSWVRSSDLQILTHAGAVFTADARVSCVESGPFHDLEVAEDLSEGGSVHTLRIARLRVADSGRYECQVNTEPKMSLFFNLTVVESALPSVVVWAEEGGVAEGPVGGVAHLACGARYDAAAGTTLAPAALAALPPLRIKWSHDGQDIDTQSMGGISLESERWSGGARSRLTLAPLASRHAGRYACRAAAPHAGPVSAALTLLVHSSTDTLYDTEESPAGEMQRDQAVARVASSAPSPPRGPLTPPASPALALLLLLLHAT